jgi:hypothetical protein
VATPSGLTAGLVADASAAGDAGVAWAVAEHRRFVDTPAEGVVSPLLEAASQVQDLRVALLPDDLLDVGLVADTGLAGLEAARDALQDDRWVRLHHVQLTVPDPEPAAVADLLTALSFTVPAYLVVSPGPGLAAALDVIADDGAERVGVRLDADHDLPTDAVADLLLGCASRRLGLMVTGDLRHALRHEADGGRPRHGFLNVLAATWAAVDGADHEAVAALLASQDPDLLMTVLEPADAARLRAVLTAVASQSPGTSCDEMRRLGLLDEEPAG